MFIEIKDYLIPIDVIAYIKRIGQGLRIVTKAGTIDISTYGDEDYEFLKLKLCGETRQHEDALTTVEEVDTTEPGLVNFHIDFQNYNPILKGEDEKIKHEWC